MFEVSIKTHFSAAHHLKGYKGKCAVPHGHNWEVEVFVRGGKLNRHGILLDFSELRKSVESVLEEVDHTDLNTFKPFKAGNPTSENIALFLYRQLSKRLNRADYKVDRVMVHETQGSAASYWECEGMDEG